MCNTTSHYYFSIPLPTVLFTEYLTYIYPSAFSLSICKCIIFYFIILSFITLLFIILLLCLCCWYFKQRLARELPSAWIKFDLILSYLIHKFLRQQEKKALFDVFHLPPRLTSLNSASRVAVSSKPTRPLSYCSTRTSSSVAVFTSLP